MAWGHFSRLHKESPPFQSKSDFMTKAEIQNTCIPSQKWNKALDGACFPLWGGWQARLEGPNVPTLNSQQAILIEVNRFKAPDEKKERAKPETLDHEIQSSYSVICRNSNPNLRYVTIASVILDKYNTGYQVFVVHKSWRAYDLDTWYSVFYRSANYLYCKKGLGKIKQQ